MCGALVTTMGVDWRELEMDIEHDTTLQLIKKELMTGEKEHKGFHVADGVLMYKGRRVIPKTSRFVPILLNEYHDSAMGGHAGEFKTYARMAGDWLWVGMRRDVARHVQQCGTCQQQKGSQRSPAGLLQPLPIPSMVWQDITLDFVDRLPMSKGINSVLVVVDRLSKYAHFLSLKHPYTAVTVAEVFLREIVRLHGFPMSIVSDRDRIFLSTFWTELFRVQGTELKRSTAYHPQTDGQTEIVNKRLETYLRFFIGGKPKSWAMWLPWAEFSYNTSPHMSTKMSPFKVLYGCDPPHLARVGSGQTQVNSLDEWLQEREAILDDLRFHLTSSQHKMKLAADGRRRDDSFQLGEQVYLKLQPYRQSSLARRPYEKLAARFYGPFKIIQLIGNVAYKLDLPATSKIHPVFHISQLKRCIGSAPSSAALPLQLTPELELEVELEEVLAVRTIQVGNSNRDELLIKWK